MTYPLAVHAQRQHGLWTRAQAVAAGIRPADIAARVTSGEWVEVRSDVYMTAMTVPDLTTDITAVALSVGGRLAFSGPTAAYVRQFPGLPPPVGIFAVIPLHRRIDVSDCSIERSRCFPTVVPRVGCIPVLGRADTLITLAPHVPAETLLDCAQELVRNNTLDLDDIDDVLRRGRSGSAALRHVLDELRPGGDSRPERKLYRALRRAGVAGFELGWELQLPEGPTYWPDLWHDEQAICVEVDGVSVHGIASRMDDDRVRQNQLTIEHDVAVPRFIPFRIDTDLDAVVAELRTAVVKRAAKVKEPRRYIARRRTDSR
jgi:hypothetical protein